MTFKSYSDEKAINALLYIKDWRIKKTMKKTSEFNQINWQRFTDEQRKTEKLIWVKMNINIDLENIKIREFINILKIWWVRCCPHVAMNTQNDFLPLCSSTLQLLTYLASICSDCCLCRCGYLNILSIINVNPQMRFNIRYLLT